MRSLLTLLCVISTPILANDLKIVTDIGPVQSLVARVTLGQANPSILISTNGSVHHSVLKPSQAYDLQKASHVIWIGPELLPQLDSMLAAIASNANSSALFATPGTTQYEMREDHGHSDHDHDADALDPHAWLDPKNAMIWIEEIAAIFQKADPDNAAAFGQNADQAIAELEQLDAEIVAAFADLELKPILTTHDAFQYFETRYGITPIGSLTDVSDNALGAKTLRKLNAELAQVEHLCVLAEAGHGSKSLQALNLPKDTTQVQLDLFGLDIEDIPNRYVTTMRRLAQQIVDCAGQ